MSCGCCGTDNFATNMQMSQKAGGVGRVNVDGAFKLYSSTRTLGNSDFCPSGAQTPFSDSAGRDYGGNFKRMERLTNADCAMVLYNLHDKLVDETNLRLMQPASPNYMGNLNTNLNY